MKSDSGKLRLLELAPWGRISLSSGPDQQHLAYELDCSEASAKRVLARAERWQGLAAVRRTSPGGVQIEGRILRIGYILGENLIYRRRIS